MKVFETPSITVEAVLASDCLPPYFQAVEIDGEHYCDGGYIILTSLETRSGQAPRSYAPSEACTPSADRASWDISGDLG
jgi:hypothetical protein